MNGPRVVREFYGLRQVWSFIYLQELLNSPASDFYLHIPISYLVDIDILHDIRRSLPQSISYHIMPTRLGTYMPASSKVTYEAIVNVSCSIDNHSCLPKISKYAHHGIS